jgi:hypothetical protein
MSKMWALMLVTALLCAAPFAFSQDAASKDTKSAATAMKHATKTAAKDTEKGAKTTGKDTKMAAEKTGHVAKVAAKDTEKGAKTAGKDTEKAADKTGHAVKKGAKGMGHEMKKGTDKTVDTLK